jgi:hypothetical protein
VKRVISGNLMRWRNAGEGNGVGRVMVGMGFWERYVQILLVWMLSFWIPDETLEC